LWETAEVFLLFWVLVKVSACRLSCVLCRRVVKNARKLHF